MGGHPHGPVNRAERRAMGQRNRWSRRRKLTPSPLSLAAARARRAVQEANR